jgi:hypothetical protein
MTKRLVLAGAWKPYQPVTLSYPLKVVEILAMSVLGHEAYILQNVTDLANSTIANLTNIVLGN